MNEVEAVVVLTILMKDGDPADRMAMFLTQFPQYRELAEERWLATFGNKWED